MNIFKMHHCSRLIIRCMDFRYNQDRALSKFASNVFNGELCDEISIAGGAGRIINPPSTNELLNDIATSVDCHNINHIVLLNHTDCGWYKKYSQDDIDVYKSDLQKAREVIINHLGNKVKDFEIDLYLARFKPEKIKFEKI